MFVLMFETFRKQTAVGDKVHLILTTGKEVIGTVETINNTHVIVNTNQGRATVFEKLLGGWIIDAQEESPLNKSGPIPDSTYMNAVDEVLTDFKNYLKIAKLSQKPPCFPFPLRSDQNKEIKKEWDKIISQYQYYSKNKNLTQLSQLARTLSALGEKYLKIGAFDYNAGCFMSALGDHRQAMHYFEKAFKSEKLPRYVYNMAHSALEIEDYKNAHIALALYFNQTLPSSDMDAWYVLCRLTEYLKGYYITGKVIDRILIKIEEKGSRINEDYNDIDLICKSTIYFLRENGNNNGQPTQIASLINNDIEINRVHSIINSSFKSLPQLSSIEYEKEAKSLEEKAESISPLPIINDKMAYDNTVETKGYIYTYKRDRNFGFLEDFYGTNYFFHRSAIIDDALFNMLNDSTCVEKIPVVFETAQGPKGPVAIQISLLRTTDEIFKLATEYANDGDYSKAISHIKRVLAINPNCSDAIKKYEEWRDYARISGVPKGLNPYARGRRAQLIQKNFKEAERLFREAILQGDNVESAVKDLAAVLVQQGFHKEAIKVLEKNRKITHDKSSVDNLLINIYRGAGEYEKAIDLLNRKLKLIEPFEKKIPLYWQIANSYLRKEDYLKAQEMFEIILKQQPDNIGAKRNIAICLVKLGSPDQAEKLLNQILDMSPDSRAAEMLEAIIQARKTGTSINFEEIITETSLSEFSRQLSGFTRFFLNRCDLNGVDPKRIKKNDEDLNVYTGSERDARYDIGILEDIASRFGTKRPRDRSSLYLSAARISQDANDDPNQFYIYLCRSFASRGDAAVVENRPLDTAREWYCEALAVYDAVRNRVKDEQDAVNALVRLLYSTLGSAQIPITPKIPSIDETLDEIIGSHPHRERVFDMIAYIVLRSRYAANRILSRLNAKYTLQALTLKYLANKGIPIPSSLKGLDDFILLWNDLRRRNFAEIHAVSSELQFLTNIAITTASIENAIEQTKNVEDKLFFDLDRQRTMHLQKILEKALDLCKQAEFEEKERLYIQIDNDCKALIEEIRDNPTKLSIEELDPVLLAIQKKVKENLEKLYATSTPQLMLRMPKESYVPDNNKIITIQIVVENRIGSSPAESLQLIVKEDEDLFSPNASEVKLDRSLKGGIHDAQILEIPLRLTSKAVESQAFSLPVYAQYRSRFEDIYQTDIQNFSIRLFDEKEFERIENPYTSYAEGGIVDDPEMFYGRDELIQNIVESIKKSQAQGKCIMVFGQKRSGKSSILHHLKNKLEKEENMLILDLGNIGTIMDEHSSTPFIYQILWNILTKLKNAIENRDKEGLMLLNLSFPSDREFYDHPTPLIFFKNFFDRYMHQASRLDTWNKARIVVIIDEFSYIYKWIVEKLIPESFMKNWKGILQEGYFNAVLAGPDVMLKFKERFPNEFGTSQDERVSYLKTEDAIKLIEDPIRIGGRFGKSRYLEQAINRILVLTGKSPFYIQILCNRLVEFMNREHTPVATQTDVERVKNELIWGINALSSDKFDNLVNSGDSSKDAINDTDLLSVLKIIAINSITGPCNRSNINCTTNLPIDVILEDLVRRNVVKRDRDQYEIEVGLFKEWLIANK